GATEWYGGRCRAAVASFRYSTDVRSVTVDNAVRFLARRNCLVSFRGRVPFRRSCVAPTAPRRPPVYGNELPRSTDHQSAPPHLGTQGGRAFSPEDRPATRPVGAGAMLTPRNKKPGAKLIWSLGLLSGLPKVCRGVTETGREHC